MYGTGRRTVFAFVAAALAGTLLAAGCSTLNVSATGAPLGNGAGQVSTFGVEDIAPMNLQVASSGSGVAVHVDSRVPLSEAVLVFTTHETEEIHLSGTSAQVLSANTAPLACIMVKADKAGDYWYFDRKDYWYFDRKDYWYFDRAGQMMADAAGETWYAGE